MVDPDLQRGQSPRPYDRGVSKKIFFVPLGPQFGLKIRIPGSTTAFKDWTYQAELQTKAYKTYLFVTFPFRII